MNASLEILHRGPLCRVQDAGRPGFRYLGIPPAGAMDPTAMHEANRLLDNRPNAPILECLTGARLRVLLPTQIALTGFGHARAWLAHPGEIVDITADLPGVWHNLALPGGVDAPRWLESASVCPRAGIGSPLAKGQHIAGVADPLSAWRVGITRRYPAVTVPEPVGTQTTPPPIRIWPGPQWAQFSAQARKAFLAQPWRISRQSDRSGYRLEGERIAVPELELSSEPVRIGAIQVPADGQPIVCLNDGPTVGGYPKIGVIDPNDLRRLVQTRPDESLHFTIAA